MTEILRVGTRSSPLARWQTQHVVNQLKATWPELECQFETFTTQGDLTLDKPLPQIGGKGLFTLELEEALHNGEIDIAVHSLKDLPVEVPIGICLGAYTDRADARDALVANPGIDWHDQTARLRVGTSSLRRTAQLRALRPDLTVSPIRGNVGTRLHKLRQGQFDAIVLAAAGLIRLGLESEISTYFSFTNMLPAPGQGVLAVQCRIQDMKTRQRLEMIDKPDLRLETDAERTFLHALGGGCSAPVGAYAKKVKSQIFIVGIVASLDGQQVIRVRSQHAGPIEAGNLLAEKALRAGAGEIIEQVEASLEY